MLDFKFQNCEIIRLADSSQGSISAGQCPNVQANVYGNGAHFVSTVAMVILLTVFLSLTHVYAQSPDYNIGDVITNPDGSKGVVFWLAPDGSGGWMCALNDVSGTFAWGTVTGMVPGFPATTTVAAVAIDTAGYSHTQRLRAAGNATTYPAAYAVDFDHGWYLPAISQLLELEAQRVTIHPVLIANGGSDVSFQKSYWSSSYETETSGYFLYCGPTTTAKSTAYYVRPVRSFSLRNESSEPEQILSYRWNTGDTTDHITVSPDSTTTYQVVVTNDAGCSNTVDFTLYVNSPNSQFFTATACGSYEWHGQTYTESGIYTYAHENTNGCAQVDTLHLTINSPDTVRFSDTVCQGEPYTGHGFNISADLTITPHVIVEMRHATSLRTGCDSCTILTLTISPTPEANIQSTADTICQGESATLSVSATSINPITPPAIAIGDILCTDNSIVKPSDWPVVGKTAMGVVFYVDNTDQHGWAVALKEFASVTWGHPNSDVAGVPNYVSARDAIADENGLSNTIAIKNFYGNDFINSPAAYRCYFYNHLTGNVGNVHNGWYLPAVGQVEKLNGQIAFVCATFSVLGSAATQPRGLWYWSSSESNTNQAWFVDSSGGMFADHNKSFIIYARPVRDF